MLLIIRLLAIVIISGLMSSLIYAADVNEIIKKSNLASYYAGDDGRAQARMIIVDANGNKQMRLFTILRKDQADLGDQDMLVFFSRPTDVKGTVFRVTKKMTSDDDRWLYLPALDLVKRISAGDKRTSFVGAHFYYEDVSGRNPAEDNFSLIKETPEHYVIKATPKDANSVEYAYYHVTIDKQNYIPMQVQYFNPSDVAIRELKVLKLENIQGFPTVLHAKMTRLTDGSYTEMQFRGVKYNIGLPDSIFSERSLRTPPKAWLK
ncbi:outer membrane lipoprotein-sorting protein [Thalassotalea sp. G2M2-11]|uniref:outer membrane lipoprotein-sorting protein n=1 Tax=Thalassotalea sp. G2M2-11 TaxID=2787627 RepID=UPI0019D1FA7F|nr:outer membrane lipoprotein-sorting protein [Thalassotalea sp. G2M2-11]